MASIGVFGRRSLSAARTFAVSGAWVGEARLATPQPVAADRATTAAAVATGRNQRRGLVGVGSFVAGVIGHSSRRRRRERRSRTLCRAASPPRVGFFWGPRSEIF